MVRLLGMSKVTRLLCSPISRRRQTIFEDPHLRTFICTWTQFGWSDPRRWAAAAVGWDFGNLGRGNEYIFYVAEYKLLIVKVLVLAIFLEGHKYFDTLSLESWASLSSHRESCQAVTAWTTRILQEWCNLTAKTGPQKEMQFLSSLLRKCTVGTLNSKETSPTILRSPCWGEAKFCW